MAALLLTGQREVEHADEAGAAHAVGAGGGAVHPVGVQLVLLQARGLIILAEPALIRPVIDHEGLAALEAARIVSPRIYIKQQIAVVAGLLAQRRSRSS